MFSIRLLLDSFLKSLGLLGINKPASSVGYAVAAVVVSLYLYSHPTPRHTHTAEKLTLDIVTSMKLSAVETVSLRLLCDTCLY